MLVRSVNFEDFLGREKNVVLRFNITEAELGEQFDLEERMREVDAIVTGPQRELTSPEKRAVFTLFKDLLKLSYGTMSDDGVYFRKSEEAWQDFLASAQYDKFITDMFTDTKLVLMFFTEIMPKKFRASVAEQYETKARELGFDLDGGSTTSTPAVHPGHIQDETTGSIEVVRDTRPAWVRENRDPTPAEVQSMSKEELLEAMQKRNAS